VSTDPKSLLDELSRLRKRARDDRHGYWFPFLAFAAIIAGAIPFYLRPECESGCSWSSADMPELWNWLHPTGQGMRLGYFHPTLWLDFYWLAALAAGFLATVWWYRWHAKRVGVETSTRLYAQVTLFVLALPLLGVPVFSELFFNRLGWPLALAVVVVGVTTATLLSKRKLRTAIAILLLILVAHFITIIPAGQLLVVVVGVLGLAWVERSTLCTVFAWLFAATVLLVAVVPIWLYGWPPLPVALYEVADLVLPSAVLAIGGVCGLVERYAVRRKVSP
jgi:hypothetical protein